MKNLFLLLFVSSSLFAQINPKILHYSETSGWDHQTRNQSYSMFQQFAFSGNATVVHDLDGSEFTSLSNLLSYDLIVFSNTSGSAILDSSQRSHFEQYISNGGNLLGMHAASDTYRHSTANGSPAGFWDFYAETLGGSVQQAPNHVSGTPVYDISKVASHPSLSNLPDPWAKPEEYYYWENGYLDTNNAIILKVEQTIGLNGMVNSYDSARSVSWYKILPTGSRIFYTSMGHARSNFTTDTLFQSHIFEASRWCMGIISSLKERSQEDFKLYPNPAEDYLRITFPRDISYQVDYIIRNTQGQVVKRGTSSLKAKLIDIRDLKSGTYFVQLLNADQSFSATFVKP
ncbi:MAG: ThuA domain-containing protein [Vicingaceae bacterium]